MPLILEKFKVPASHPIRRPPANVILGRELEEIDFSDKLVAIFGCGDQEDYAEYFLDAMGMVRDIVEAKGAILIGQWPSDSYDFEASKGMADESHFVGLGIDEDRQPELTDERVKAWCKQIHEEMCLSELS